MPKYKNTQYTGKIWDERERVERGRLEGVKKFTRRVSCLTCCNFIGNMVEFRHHKKVCKGAKGGIG